VTDLRGRGSRFAPGREEGGVNMGQE